MRNNLSGSYELGIDLDFNDDVSYDTTTSTTGYETVEEFKTAMTSGTGWNPVGTSTAIFTGTFDGKTHIISNLFINRPDTSYIGLFGYASSTQLANISLENVDISGKSYVGGLVGMISSTSIINSYTTGLVNGGGDEDSNIGGLIGSCFGSSITDSYSMANVSNGYNIGGLIGSLNTSSNSSISNSYAMGNVSGSVYVGGFIG